MMHDTRGFPVTEPNMHEAAQRSLRVFPAGSNGELKLPPELSMVIALGEGCEVEDRTGAAFLDFSLGWGSMLVGHAQPEVVEAAVCQAAFGLGANFPCVNKNSLALSATLGASRSSGYHLGDDGVEVTDELRANGSSVQRTVGGNGRDLTRGERLKCASDVCLRDCAATLEARP